MLLANAEGGDMPRRASFWAQLVRPFTWARWVRRLVLITFPISIPCIAALVVVVPILATFNALVRVLDQLWNRERRIIYRSEHYSDYSPRSRSPAAGLIPRRKVVADQE